MATLGTNNLTLADCAKRQDPSGKTTRIVELLQQSNPILDDMQWFEANGVDGHTTTVRTGLPKPVWRLLNQGVATTKSTTAQITEGIGMLEDRSQLDVDLAKRGGDLEGLRLSESAPHFEGMNQEMAKTLFYGNTTTKPEQYHGLSARYSSKSAANGVNVLDAGGVGSDNSSIWLICWSEQTIHGIFPKGSQAGLLHEDLGVGDALDASNNRFRAYMDRWQWKAGIALRDWRYVVRIANIDISNLSTESGAADLTKLMIRATKRILNPGMGKCVWYMNRTCEQMLDIQRYNQVGSGGGVRYETVDGVPMMTFRSYPIRIVDQLTETEAQVT